jgi:hypothetical protein
MSTLNTMKQEIRATVARRANGWAAVLEYPNGGRQMFSSRFGTMDEAQREAISLLHVRTSYPEGVIADPAANQLMDLDQSDIGDVM